MPCAAPSTGVAARGCPKRRTGPYCAADIPITWTAAVDARDLPPILKFPRTPHLEGSSIQAGDDDVRVAVGALPRDCVYYYDEKVDGANCGVRFDGSGDPLLQSRGHYLDAADRNAPRERDWSLLKDWIALHRDALLERFEDRYTVYGEWAAITHSCFYDRLPSYFLEFAIYDMATERFLDTTSRRSLCAGLPIASAPVLARSERPLGYADMVALVGPSAFKTPERRSGHNEWDELLAGGGDWQDSLRRACALVGDDFPRRLAKMDRTDLTEGLYVRAERNGEVVGRYKWVRPGFTQTILAADEHWQSRFPVPNLLAGPADGFPVHLARSRQPTNSCYDADTPWDWAPWTAARRGPDVLASRPR